MEHDEPYGKTKPSTEDRRLVRLTKICLALPESTRDYNGQHAGFHFRKRTFAYFLNDLSELAIGSYRMAAPKGLATRVAQR